MGLDIGKVKASRPREGFIPNPKLKLLEQVSVGMRLKRHSLYYTQVMAKPGLGIRSSLDEPRNAG
jgi:hypothetical protein